LSLQISILSAFETNYIFLVYEPNSKTTMVVDPGDPEVVINELKKKSLKLNFIWNTHHHPDHVGGNLELKKRTGCHIVGPKKEQDKIPGIDQSVEENDILNLGKLKAQVFETPGHTLGSLCYFFNEQKIIFVGDTLFAAGCGRLFEGTPEQMFQSLQKFQSLPLDTQIYCAHEYTLSNCEFALSLTPEDKILKKRYRKVKSLRSKDLSTIPYPLKEDIETNPFLGTKRTAIQNLLNPQKKLSEAQVFAKIREMKDGFRSL